MSQALSHVVSWSHQLLAPVINQGDLAVDLTAGNGYDTLELAQRVGRSGSVLAFDLQLQALEHSAERLENAGIEVTHLRAPVESLPPGASLVQDSHARLSDWCCRAPRAIIVNLGYLPGGNRELTTTPESTLPALQAGCEILAPGGRIAVVVYTEHPGGRNEADVVESFFTGLDGHCFEVLRLEVANRPQAPFLLVAGKLIG